MNEFFSSDGPLIQTMQKIGYLILLGILFIICSLPVVTTGAAMSALYYAVVKSVRRERGYPTKEFFKALKRNLKNGTILTLVFGGALLLVIYNRYLLYRASADEMGGFRLLGNAEGGVLTVYMIYDGLLVLLMMIVIYLFPVLSRFAMKLGDIVKLSFVISIRYFYFTVLLLLELGILGFLQWKALPAPTILLLPGVWAYSSSFLIEKAMRKYTPEPKPGEDAWYLE